MFERRLSGAYAVLELSERAVRHLTEPEDVGPHRSGGISLERAGKRRRAELPRRDLGEHPITGESPEQPVQSLGMRATEFRQVGDRDGTVGDEVGHFEGGRGVQRLRDHEAGEELQ